MNTEPWEDSNYRLLRKQSLILETELVKAGANELAKANAFAKFMKNCESVPYKMSLEILIKTSMDHNCRLAMHAGLDLWLAL